MSIPVELTELSAAAAKHPFGYLITIDDRSRTHVVSAQPHVEATGVTVGDLGRRSLANAAAQPLVTLVWPPADTGGYSLIVDGEVESSADRSITIRPKRAVLHRPAPGSEPGADDVCGHDCVEVPVRVGSNG